MKDVRVILEKFCKFIVERGWNQAGFLFVWKVALKSLKDICGRKSDAENRETLNSFQAFEYSIKICVFFS